MRYVVSQCLLWVVLVVASPRAGGAPAPHEPGERVARWHFGGFDALARSTNGTTLQEIWKLPETVQFREATLERIAQALAPLFSPRSNRAAESSATLIRPLLDDLWKSESFFEASETSGGKPEWLLAIRLSRERRRVWQNQATKLRSGWNFQHSGGAAPIAFSSEKGWFVIGSSAGGGADWIQKHATFREIERQGHPASASADYWLKLDLSRLSEWFPDLKSFGLATADVQVIPRRENLRTEVALRYATPRSWQIDPWLIPTNTIRDPLIGFTAVQGLGPWVKKQTIARELELGSPPNQLFLWSQALRVPLQIFGATPVPNPAEVLRRFETNVVPRLNDYLKRDGVGSVEPVTNQTRLVWQGLPILVPSLRAVERDGDRVLLADIFPLDQTPYTNPPPAALFQQLTSRTNLIYYDWEITEPRLLQVRPLINLLSIVLTVPPQNTNALSSKWLDSIQPKLGEAITEVAVRSPSELSVVRRSHIGFTSLELLALTHWLESANFPKADFRVSFQEAVKQKPATPRTP